ncbi:MAG: chloride channel protein, partial [Limisphaerales bacterium]
MQGALRWREKLVLKEEGFHFILAGAVGVIGGLVNFFFYEAVHLISKMLNATMAIHTGDIVEVVEGLPDWQRVLLPTVGGLAAGLILHWGLRLVGNQGPTNLLEVVVAGDGRLPTRTDLVKSCSAIVSIATGASIGREGGIVQLAATLASK